MREKLKNLKLGDCIFNALTMPQKGKNTNV